MQRSQKAASRIFTAVLALLSSAYFFVKAPKVEAAMTCLQGNVCWAHGMSGNGHCLGNLWCGCEDNTGAIWGAGTCAATC